MESLKKSNNVLDSEKALFQICCKHESPFSNCSTKSNRAKATALLPASGGLTLFLSSTILLLMGVAIGVAGVTIVCSASPVTPHLWVQSVQCSHGWDKPVTAQSLGPVTILCDLFLSYTKISCCSFGRQTGGRNYMSRGEGCLCHVIHRRPGNERKSTILWEREMWFQSELCEFR